jgi:hypothetical protein
VIDNESRELLAVHHTGFIVAEAGQCSPGRLGPTFLWREGAQPISIGICSDVIVPLQVQPRGKRGVSSSVTWVRWWRSA